ncbi:MAG: hypothetical protein GTO40_19940 [Deltaproteobacteria bacterium]|nr:hypothetical protein [Deltaproteobacteria bacterium]
MAEEKRVEAKVIYRSNHSQLSLITIMERAGIWDQLGVDVTRMELKRNATEAEEELLSGRCNVIFGCHITPHVRVINGDPLVCMAQAVNVAEDMLVSTEPVGDLAELKGKNLAEEKLCNEHGHLNGHPRGTHELYLRDAGISSDMMGIQAPTKEKSSVQLLLDGKADAFFTNATREAECKRLGLYTKVMPVFPMVNSITLTSTVPYVQDNPELYRRMTKGLALGIAFIHKEKEKTLEALGGQVADRLGIKDDDELEQYYQKLLNILNPRLCPDYQSLYNAYRIAEIVYPVVKEKGNPVKLWDLHYVRQLEAEGFFDKIYK